MVEDLFTTAKKGRVWYSLNPDDAAVALGQERRRVVRAIEYIEEHGWAEVRAGDVRQRYTRLREREDAGALAAELAERFERREAQEIARLQQVLALAAHEGCQTNALVRYFGEERGEPCGHCSYCLTGQAAELPAPAAPAPLAGRIDVREWQQLRDSHPEALGHPRQAARFLCGLTSPAVTRARLSRHPLFGKLEDCRFAEVLEWVG
jgi:ATP-dependent DNA helicase RecQ